MELTVEQIQALKKKIEEFYGTWVNTEYLSRAQKIVMMS